jgi:hypothetical protein
MTAQMPDQVRYRGKTYDIIGVKGESLLTPDQFGIQVGMWHTACYRGYVSTYTCEDQELFLTELHIGQIADDAQWKPINGIQPETQYLDGYTFRDGKKVPVRSEFGKKYLNLKVETYFSGGILIAADFIQSLYVHMGFGKPYQYEHVHELLFHEGTLTQEADHSPKAAEWREAIIRQHEELQRRIEELREAGLSNEDIFKQLRQQPSKDDIVNGIEWRFSLDYGSWF